jgi:nucleoside-diphosphate-sugar epimerase
MDDVVSLPDSAARLRKGRESPRARVLVTGIDGYIGSVLAWRLLEAGYAVVGLDTRFYHSGCLFHDNHDQVRILCRDVRQITVADLRGYDAVVHLAELSNDPLCEFDEKATYDINHKASVALAHSAKAAGVKRFVYASSCSVYGAAGTEEKSEDSDLNPQTAYARCKVMVEQDVGGLEDLSFAPTFLRNATAFGASPRMRFDIVLNNLAGLAWTTKCIRMTSDGTPWRPLVHVQDICEAVLAVLEAPVENVSGEVFNVGADDQNYRVRDIVETVAQVFTDCSVEVGHNNGDNRSYRVSFRKIREHLPGFRCRWDSLAGAMELRTIFEQIAMTEEIFNAPPYTRLKQLRHLLETQQVDSRLFWRAPMFARPDAPAKATG